MSRLVAVRCSRRMRAGTPALHLGGRSKPRPYERRPAAVMGRGGIVGLAQPEGAASGAPTTEWLLRSRWSADESIRCVFCGRRMPAGTPALLSAAVAYGWVGSGEGDLGSRTRSVTV